MSSESLLVLRCVPAWVGVTGYGRCDLASSGYGELVSCGGGEGRLGARSMACSSSWVVQLESEDSVIIERKLVQHPWQR